MDQHKPPEPPPSEPPAPITAVDWRAKHPIDQRATPETKALFTNLRGFTGKGILFGHQNSTIMGLAGGSWRGDPQRSDVKSACGQYSAVYGWDVESVVGREIKTQELVARRIVEAFERGGVNTMSWHMSNPITGKNFYDCTRAVANLLPGGDKHDFYKSWMEYLAQFAARLIDAKGRRVPIIFRPFHEHTGHWFWWCRPHCTSREFIDLWRFTVEYLRDHLGVHQFLYAYSPANRPQKNGGYFERYPGDAYVDVLGLDHYCQSTNEALEDLRLIVDEAARRGQIAAFTETGIHKGIAGALNDHYFTQGLLAPIKNDPIARRITYMMTWRNYRDKEGRYWIPYEGGGGRCLLDFQNFASDPAVVMENRLPEMYGREHQG